jgi:hypothetical protein
MSAALSGARKTTFPDATTVIALIVLATVKSVEDKLIVAPPKPNVSAPLVKSFLS